MHPNQVPTQRLAELAQTSGHQDGAFSVKRPRRPQDQLPDMARLRHVLVRRRRLTKIVGLHRKRRQAPRLQQRRHIAQHRRDQLSSRLRQVESAVRDPRMLAAHNCGVADVCLAHLEEPAPPGQQAQRRIDEPAGQ